MEIPKGALRQPARVEIGQEECGLKEDEAGDPDRCRSAECRQQLFGGDGFDKEEQEGGEKDSAAKKNS